MSTSLGSIGSLKLVVLAGAVLTNGVLATRAWREAKGTGRKWAVAVLAVFGTSTLGWIVARLFAD